jgi:hypothetical protein
MSTPFGWQNGPDTAGLLHREKTVVGECGDAAAGRIRSLRAAGPFGLEAGSVRNSSDRRQSVASDQAVSQTHGVLLMVAITVILAILVLLLFRLPPMTWGTPLPSIVILSVEHMSDRSPYGLNYDSRILLYHNGTKPYENDGLRAVIYRNGERVCIIPTLNGYRFIQSHHYGSERIEGEGCRTLFWNPGEGIEIDIVDGTLYPGVDVTVEIINRTTDAVISRDSITA